MSAAEPRRGQAFRYEGYDIDPDAGRLTCRYSLDGRDFAETVTFPGGADWSSPAADAAARLVFLLAGVSYYKTGAPPVIDLGDHPLTAEERTLLHAYYFDGLGEFAYENGLDLSDVEIVAGETQSVLGSEVVGEQPLPTQERGADAGVDTRRRPEPLGVDLRRALVPFGGGLDSVVTVELVRPVADDVALFVVNPPGDRFDAIERAIKVTGLPVVRAERAIDPQVRRPIRETGFLNGHVPVTGIISAIAVLAAVLERRGAVVMSNEWSASKGTLEVDGRWINHQWSKSLDFERMFRAVVASSVAPDVEYFSRLRPHTELAIARRFAELSGYHLEFHSCNRAFASDPARRLDHWCGECPKCCFIDLILAPFLPEERLRQIFGGREPLADPALRDEFDRLLATTDSAKPFECVGDVAESRVAVALAARRPDRQAFPLLHELAATVATAAPVPHEPATGSAAGPDATGQAAGAASHTDPVADATGQAAGAAGAARQADPMAGATGQVATAAGSVRQAGATGQAAGAAGQADPMAGADEAAHVAEARNEGAGAADAADVRDPAGGDPADLAGRAGPGGVDIGALMRPIGPHFIPDPYATDDLVV